MRTGDLTGMLKQRRWLARVRGAPGDKADSSAVPGRETDWLLTGRCRLKPMRALLRPRERT
jgi:hypothetical protein